MNKDNNGNNENNSNNNKIFNIYGPLAICQALL